MNKILKHSGKLLRLTRDQKKKERTKERKKNRKKKEVKDGVKKKWIRVERLNLEIMRFRMSH